MLSTTVDAWQLAARIPPQLLAEAPEKKYFFAVERGEGKENFRFESNFLMRSPKRAPLTS